MITPMIVFLLTFLTTEIKPFILSGTNVIFLDEQTFVIQNKTRIDIYKSPKVISTIETIFPYSDFLGIDSSKRLLSRSDTSVVGQDLINEDRRDIFKMELHLAISQKKLLFCEKSNHLFRFTDSTILVTDVERFQEKAAYSLKNSLPKYPQIRKSNIHSIIESTEQLDVILNPLDDKSFWLRVIIDKSKKAPPTIIELSENHFVGIEDALFHPKIPGSFWIIQKGCISRVNSGGIQKLTDCRQDYVCLKPNEDGNMLLIVEKERFHKITTDNQSTFSRFSCNFPKNFVPVRAAVSKSGDSFAVAGKIDGEEKVLVYRQKR